MQKTALFAVLGSAALLAADTFTPRQRQFWSFQKIQPQTPPATRNPVWARNPIDQFILAKLEAKGIAPVASADKITLLRRASFDLIGLPPTPEEADAFLADQSPQAFEKVVDRLLASPQYGERWGRHWLDLARFAESEGFKSDEARPNGRLCLETDAPVAALLTDLKARGLLDTTLVVWGGEFGRTAFNEKGNGRDHNPWGFSVWMAGGGTRKGQVTGRTDDIGLPAIERPVHVHDLHATILWCLGLDHVKVNYLHNARSQRPTIVSGEVIRGAIA